MTSIGILIIWFGKLPGWFPLWLLSASGNPTVDFHVLTDQSIPEHPSNVFVHSSTLSEESNRFSSFFSRKIDIRHPYKFCDFKPMLGAVYEDILSPYDFWGESDIDLMYGDIRQFVTEEVLSRYQRVYEFGDFSLYRNSEQINSLFLKRGSIYSLDEVLDPDVHVAFDEYYGITRICHENGIECYSGVEDKAGILPLWKSTIRLCSTRNYEKQLVYWHQGRVFQAYADDLGALNRREYLLCHWQKKRPELNVTPLATDAIALTPTELVRLQRQVPSESMLQSSKLHYSDALFYYANKCRKIISMSPAQRSLYLRAVRERFGAS